jgi:hypothetical protein
MARLEYRYKIIADRKRSPITGRDTGRITRLPYTPFPSITQTIRPDGKMNEIRRIVIGDDLSNDAEANLNERRSLIEAYKDLTTALWDAFMMCPRRDFAEKLVRAAVDSQFLRDDFPKGPVVHHPMFASFNFCKHIRRLWDDEQALTKILIKASYKDAQARSESLCREIMAGKQGLLGNYFNSVLIETTIELATDS